MATITAAYVSETKLHGRVSPQDAHEPLLERDVTSGGGVNSEGDGFIELKLYKGLQIDKAIFFSIY